MAMVGTSDSESHQLRCQLLHGLPDVSLLQSTRLGLQIQRGQSTWIVGSDVLVIGRAGKIRRWLRPQLPPGPSLGSVQRRSWSTNVAVPLEGTLSILHRPRKIDAASANRCLRGRGPTLPLLPQTTSWRQFGRLRTCMSLIVVHGYRPRRRGRSGRCHF